MIPGRPAEGELSDINATLKELGLPLVEGLAELRFMPPQAVRDAARQGLELRRITGRGGLDRAQAARQGVSSGVARGEQLAAGEPVTLAEVRRIRAFFARHDGERERNARLSNQRSPANVAWLLWGGDAGRAWAEAILREHAPDPVVSSEGRQRRKTAKAAASESRRR